MEGLTRRGLYALPLAGLVTVLPWLLMLSHRSNITRDPDAYARGLTSAAYPIAGYVYLAGFILLLFGLIALCSTLVSSRADLTAVAGLVVSVVAVALLLPVFGILFLADSVLADVYLAGHKDVVVAMTQLSGGTFSNRINRYFLVFVVIALIGGVINAVAIWRSGRLPRWAGVLFAAGFVLSVTITPVIAWVGSLCLMAAGLWLARSAAREPVDRPKSAVG
jgi:hypothetical protein